MDKDAIRIVECMRADVESKDVSQLVRLFGTLAQQPDKAKLLRGKVILGFSAYDSDPRPNYAIPAIREFIKASDAAMPHFPYFLVGNPALGHILFYLLCLVRFADLDKLVYSSAELIEIATKKTEIVASFCDKISDDGERVSERIFLDMPAELLIEVPSVAKKALQLMRPVLSRIEYDLRQGNIKSELKVFVDDVLNRAAILAGVDRSQFTSDSNLARELLTRATPQVTNEELGRFEHLIQLAIQRLGTGKVLVSTDQVRKAVRTEPRAAYRYIEIHLLESASQPGYLQPAMTVAAAIFVELGDEEPMRSIERRCKELGVDPSTIEPQIFPSTK